MYIICYLMARSISMKIIKLLVLTKTTPLWTTQHSTNTVSHRQMSLKAGQKNWKTMTHTVTDAGWIFWILFYKYLLNFNGLMPIIHCTKQIVLQTMFLVVAHNVLMWVLSSFSKNERSSWQMQFDWMHSFQCQWQKVRDVFILPFKSWLVNLFAINYMASLILFTFAIFPAVCDSIWQNLRPILGHFQDTHTQTFKRIRHMAQLQWKTRPEQTDRQNDGTQRWREA